MKKLAILSLFILAFASCKTVEQRAQRHIRKAIALDPKIISKQKTDTVIKGIAEGVVPVTTPELKGEISFDCDSIKNEFEKLKQAGKPPVIVMGADSNIVLEVTKDKNGKSVAKYTVKPKTIYVPVKVPYEVKVSVPGKAINVPVDRPFYVYKWFWILLALSLLLLFICIKLALNLRKTNIILTQSQPKNDA